MKVKTSEFVTALLLLAASAVLYQQSKALDMAVTYAQGPAFFPRILIGILAALSLLLLAQSVRFGGAAKAAGAAPKAAGDRAAFANRWGLVGLLVAYLVLLPLLGYLTATIPFLFAGMLLLGPRKPRDLAVYAAVSLGVTFGLQFVFATLLKLFLP